MHIAQRIQTGISGVKTKIRIIAVAAVLGGTGLAAAVPFAANAATCTPTGFFRDGINLTAASINPTATVSGEVDATGCNIGVYYGPTFTKKGKVDGANIHGANYYGVVVQKAKVDVTNSFVHQIGETPLNGSQHGVGIYYATIAGVQNGDCTTGSTSGQVTNNSVSSYQKGGIVVACTGSEVDVKRNVVQGEGPVNYIAQNGIQIGYGAKSEVSDNMVADNSYTGANQASSAGILVVGGGCYGGDVTKKTDIGSNKLVNNDVGVYLSNLDAGTCAPSSTETKINVQDNRISNARLNNTTGNSATQGYQSGVSDQGNKDNIRSNTIEGAGYNPAYSSASISTSYIDVSSTNHAKVHANKYR